MNSTSKWLLDFCRIQILNNKSDFTYNMFEVRSSENGDNESHIHQHLVWNGLPCTEYCAGDISSKSAHFILHFLRPITEMDMYLTLCRNPASSIEIKWWPMAHASLRGPQILYLHQAEETCTHTSTSPRKPPATNLRTKIHKVKTQFGLIYDKY